MAGLSCSIAPVLSHARTTLAAAFIDGCRRLKQEGHTWLAAPPPLSWAGILLAAIRGATSQLFCGISAEHCRRPGARLATGQKQSAAAPRQDAPTPDFTAANRPGIQQQPVETARQRPRAAGEEQPPRHSSQVRPGCPPRLHTGPIGGGVAGSAGAPRSWRRQCSRRRPVGRFSPGPTRRCACPSLHTSDPSHTALTPVPLCVLFHRLQHHV